MNESQQMAKTQNGYTNGNGNGYSNDNGNAYKKMNGNGHINGNGNGIGFEFDDDEAEFDLVEQEFAAKVIQVFETVQ